MEAIEPVSFTVKGSGLEPTDYQPRLARRHGRGSTWDETHDFLLNRALEETDCEELSVRTMIEEFQELVEEKTGFLSDIVPGLYEDLTRFFMPGFPRTRPLYHRGECVVVPNQSHNGHFYIISNNKNEARALRDEIIEGLKEAEETYKELGVTEIDTFSGGEYTLNIIRNTEKVTGVTTGESDEFEQEIYDELKPFSEALVHNVTVSFNFPPEPEYDILLALSPGQILNLELEDHSGTDSQPGENDLIDNPLSEADYINASKIYSVVRGIDSDNLSQYRESATLRNIRILKKEQVAEEVANHIQNEMVPEVLELESPP